MIIMKIIGLFIVVFGSFFINEMIIDGSETAGVIGMIIGACSYVIFVQK